MAGYEDVIEKAINKEKSVISDDAAVEVASNTDGLEVDDNGNVQALTAPGKQVLENLVDEYMEVAGNLVPRIIGGALEKEDFGGEEIPEILEEYV